MPRTPLQAVAFLLGFGLALLLAPLRVDLARAFAESAPGFADLEAGLLAEVNAVRAQHHLIPLQRSPALDAVARRHSADMARRAYFSHETPEGRNPVDRIFEAGVDGFTLAAENLGRTDRGDPNRAIVQGWLHSPDHRRNLLTPPFNTTGIGIARASDGSFLYTQIYITIPKPASTP